MTVQDKGDLPRGLIYGLAPPYSLYILHIKGNQTVNKFMSICSDDPRLTELHKRCYTAYMQSTIRQQNISHRRQKDGLMT